jgi:hypothetical protein
MVLRHVNAGLLLAATLCVAGCCCGHKCCRTSGCCPAPCGPTVVGSVPVAPDPCCGGAPVIAPGSVPAYSSPATCCPTGLRR